MSNVYNLEPPVSGKVIVKTTYGDIEFSLFAKESPKACRNFVQLCLEGYYDNTIFHRYVSWHHVSIVSNCTGMYPSGKEQPLRRYYIDK